MTTSVQQKGLNRFQLVSSGEKPRAINHNPEILTHTSSGGVPGSKARGPSSAFASASSSDSAWRGGLANQKPELGDLLKWPKPTKRLKFRNWGSEKRRKCLGQVRLPVLGNVVQDKVANLRQAAPCGRAEHAPNPNLRNQNWLAAPTAPQFNTAKDKGALSQRAHL